MPPPLQWKRIHICNIFGMPDIITITLSKRNPITNQLPNKNHFKHGSLGRYVYWNSSDYALDIVLSDQ